MNAPVLLHPLLFALMGVSRWVPILVPIVDLGEQNLYVLLHSLFAQRVAGKLVTIDSWPSLYVPLLNLFFLQCRISTLILMLIVKLVVCRLFVQLLTLIFIVRYVKSTVYHFFYLLICGTRVLLTSILFVFQLWIPSTRLFEELVQIVGKLCISFSLTFSCPFLFLFLSGLLSSSTIMFSSVDDLVNRLSLLNGTKFLQDSALMLSTDLPFTVPVQQQLLWGEVLVRLSHL
jgi:hypothetical protein